MIQLDIIYTTGKRTFFFVFFFACSYVALPSLVNSKCVQSE